MVPGRHLHNIVSIDAKSSLSVTSLLSWIAALPLIPKKYVKRSAASCAFQPLPHRETDEHKSYRGKSVRKNETVCTYSVILADRHVERKHSPQAQTCKAGGFVPTQRSMENRPQDT